MATLEITARVRLPWWRRWPAIALVVVSVFCHRIAEWIIDGGIEIE